jgi:hypothetical protein
MRSDLERLRDILEAIERIERYVEVPLLLESLPCPLRACPKFVHVHPCEVAYGLFQKA